MSKKLFHFPFGTVQQHQKIFDLVAEHTVAQRKYHEFSNFDFSEVKEAVEIVYKAQEEMFALENQIIDALLSDPDLYELVIYYSDVFNGDFPRERAELLLAMHQRGLEKRRKRNPGKGKSVLGALVVGGIIGHSMKKK